MKMVQRFLFGVSLLPALLPLPLSGCGNKPSDDKPESAEKRQQLKHDLAEEISRTKKEYTEKIKELQRKYEAVQASTAVAVTGRAEQKILERDVEQPGWIMSMETTPIYTFYPAYIQKMGDHKHVEPDGTVVVHPVDMGDIVKKGDVLATLYVPEREDDLALKKAMVEESQRELTVAVTFLKVADAHVELAASVVKEEESVLPRIKARYDRWKSEHARIEQLAKKSVLDQAVLEETLNQYKAAEGEVGEVNAKIKKAMAAHLESIAKRAKAEADVKLAEVRVQVAREHENVSKSLLDYKDIKAPFDGMITQRIHHTGRFVTPPSGAAKIDPLFTIVRMDVMRIMIDVPEADSPFIRKGEKAHVRIPALDNREFPGTVTRTSWVLDQTNRTLRVEIDLPNPKGELRPGHYAYGSIPVQVKGQDGKGVWTMPDSALIRKEEEGNFFFRIGDDGTAILTPVRLGIRVGHRVQVLKYRKKLTEANSEAIWSEFTGAETIIMNPSFFVDGMKIEKTKSLN
jgi:HlyD family secretion protein